MKNGVSINDATKLPYFTGYANTTLYDWDQYFEAIAQLYMGYGTTYIKNAVLIYLAHQQPDGFTKRAIQNGYSGEEDYEMVKPFLSQLCLLCYHYDHSLSWLDETVLLKLQKSLDYWLNVRDKRKQHLSIWRSSIESGMDDQHERGGRWRSDFCEGVDLNSYLYRESLAFAALCRLLDKPDLAAAYEDAAAQKKAAVQTLWDPIDHFFYDHDIRTDTPIKVKSIASFTPVWAGIATDEQVRLLVTEHIMNPDEFWRPYPLPALAATEPGYSSALLPGDIGCNWRANTWIPTNYLLAHGLVHYGYDDLARTLAEKSKELLTRSGEREYYLTETGEGTGLNPFWGWSLLGYFLELELKHDFDPTLL